MMKLCGKKNHLFILHVFVYMCSDFKHFEFENYVKKVIGTSCLRMLICLQLSYTLSSDQILIIHDCIFSLLRGGKM